MLLFWLIFIPIAGLLLGAVARTVAVSQGWVTGLNGPSQKWVVIGCFLLWLIGPWLCVDYGFWIRWIRYLARSDLDFAVRMFVGISTILFLLAGVALGWCLAPESSVWEAREKKRLREGKNPFASPDGLTPESYESESNPFTDLGDSTNEK